MNLPEITAALSSFKIAINLIKSITLISKDVAINDKSIELQNVILGIQSAMLELQSKYYELLQSKSELENKLINFENWNITVSQYDLIDAGNGSFIYMPNKNHPSPNPNHYLCTNCFSNKTKSLLQIVTKYNTGFCNFKCPKCQFVVGFYPDKLK